MHLFNCIPLLSVVLLLTPLAATAVLFFGYQETRKICILYMYVQIEQRERRVIPLLRSSILHKSINLIVTYIIGAILLDLGDTVSSFRRQSRLNEETVSLQ